MSDEERFNSAALDMLRRIGGNKLVTQMTDMFFQNAPRKLEEISVALSTLDHSAGERSAHSLKSSAGQLGAVELQRLCGDLELALEAGNTEHANTLLVDASQELEIVVAWLSASIASNPDTSAIKTP